MPRVNPLRSLANERNVAERIAFEREQRGWSYEGTAQRMTDAGCPIQSSAIFKVEKGDPPRRITVDELVGFADVFDLEVSEILVPMALVEQRRAQAVIKELGTVGKQLAQAIHRMFNMYAEYFVIAAERPDLLEYINDHYSGDEPDDGEQWRPFGTLSVDGAEADDDLRDLKDAMLTLIRAIVSAAGDRVDAANAAEAANRKTKKARK